ncbi:hypothetical protein SAMN04488514_12145 [Kriegella aquimaris]|uniref:Uncharacterized protein n=2 Tax=Kriegella aquimaris TaxID=192904 RepID=A0A1G9Y9V3_9FLAO|nr:hypothetical protein SAMN04488514_12145 [Kriegella aquimaris]
MSVSYFIFYYESPYLTKNDSVEFYEHLLSSRMSKMAIDSTFSGFTQEEVYSLLSETNEVYNKKRQKGLLTYLSFVVMLIGLIVLISFYYKFLLRSKRDRLKFESAIKNDFAESRLKYQLLIKDLKQKIINDYRTNNKVDLPTLLIIKDYLHKKDKDLATNILASQYDKSKLDLLFIEFEKEI